MPQWWPLMVISEQALAPATPSTPMCGSVVAGVCSPPQNCERNIVAMGMGERARTVGSAAIAPLQRLLRPMAQPALCATQPDSFSEYVFGRATRKNNRRLAHSICFGNGGSERQFQAPMSANRAFCWRHWRGGKVAPRPGSNFAVFPASDKCPRSVFLGSGLRLERFFPGGGKPLLM